MSPTIRKAAVTGALLCVIAAAATAVYQRPEILSLTSRKTPEVDIQKLVRESSGGNAKLEKVLPLKIAGLTGAILNSNGQRFVAWLPAGTNTIMVGALFNNKGENLTAEAMKQQQMTNSAQPAPTDDMKGPPSTFKAKDGVINAVEKADGILEGRGGPIVHVFMDLNCGYCKDLYAQLTPLVDNAQLRVHWIPVAVLHPSSVTLAAEVLQAKDGPTTLAEHEFKFDPAAGKAGLSGQPPSAKTQKIIEANTELLKVVNNNVPAVPLMLFRAKNGEVVQHPGVLREPSDLIDAIN